MFASVIMLQVNLEEVLGRLQIAALNEMQEKAIEVVSKGGDVVLLAPTGSGKTLAFLLPVLMGLDANAKGVQCLIVSPSRELSLQIEQVWRQMGTGYKIVSCYGGHDFKTERNALFQAPAVLIGTPGRLAHHLELQTFDESHIRMLVLDEFDKSLELGFQDDMAYIIGMLKSLRQRILTSATAMEVLPSFTGIRTPLTIDFLKDASSTPHFAFYELRSSLTGKAETLLKLLCKVGSERSLVFCNQRETTEQLSLALGSHRVVHDIYHGGMDQDDRERALMKFRNGSVTVLLTTDLAARGLDIAEVHNIIHYQMPTTREAFVHRNGRTARMNAAGSVFLLLADGESISYELSAEITNVTLPDEFCLPAEPMWKTLYFSAGKKDKINKIDIAGLLLKKGGLKKEDLGLIVVKEHQAFAAVKGTCAEGLLKSLAGQRIKNKKIKIALAL